MKKAAVPSILSAVVLLAVAVIAEAQPLPIRVGYTALAGSFSPLWVAKELDLFERQGIHSSPIDMASTLAYQVMLAGETDFTVGASAILVLGTSPAEFLRTRNEMIREHSKDFVSSKHHGTEEAT